MVTGDLLVLIGSFAAMFLWSRSESREDNRRIEGLIEAIKQDMKDFQGRLCAIEERKKMEKE